MTSQNNRLILLFSLICMGLLCACGTVAQPPQTTVTNTALVQQGIEVYRTQYCGMCHILSAAETHGTFGPAHDDLGATALERIQDAAYSGTATSAEAYIRESIIEPAVFKVPDYALSNHAMPSYAHLPQEDIDALVYMLMHQE